MIEEWFEIKKIYNLYFLNYENLRIEENFIDWNSYLRHYNGNKNLLQMKFWYSLCFSEFKKNKLKFLSSKLKTNKNFSIGITGLLLDSIDDRFNTNDNIKGLEQFFQLNNFNSYMVNWIQMSKFYLLSVHPQGEAKRVAINEKL